MKQEGCSKEKRAVFMFLHTSPKHTSAYMTCEQAVAAKKSKCIDFCQINICFSENLLQLLNVSFFNKK